MTTTFNWVAVSSHQIVSFIDWRVMQKGFKFSLVFRVRKNGFIVTFRLCLPAICR